MYQRHNPLPENASNGLLPSIAGFSENNIAAFSQPDRLLAATPVTADRELIIAAGGQLVCLSVCSRFGIAMEDLMRRTRGKANVSRARQVAMYVMHTSLSLSYQEVADFFRRDRTTISHACALIEDERDIDSTEADIALLESLVAAALDLHCAAGGGK